MSHLRFYPNILKAVSVLLVGGCLLGAELRPGESLLQEGYSYRSQGHQLQQVGDLKNAAAAYRKAIAVHPGYAEAYNDLGVVLESLGRLPGAEEAYKSALRLSPNLGAAHSNLALLYEQMGRMQEAGRHWGARTRIGSPDDPWVMQARRRLHQYNLTVPKTSEELAFGRENKIRLVLRQGRAHLKSKRWDEAIGSFQEVLALDSAHAGAARLLRKAMKQAARAEARRVKELTVARERAAKQEAEEARKLTADREKAKKREAMRAKQGAKDRKIQARKRAAERKRAARQRRKARLSKKSRVRPSKLEREQTAEQQDFSRLSAEAETLARDLAREKGKARGNAVRELYQRAVASMRQGRYQEAVSHFDQVLTLKPEHRKAKQGRKRAQQALAKAERTRRTLR